MCHSAFQITVLALIASVSAKPYGYGYGTYAPRGAYIAPELYSPDLSAAYSYYGAGYPTAYSAAFSSFPATYTASPSGGISQPFALPPGATAFGSGYSVEEYAPVGAVAPVTPVAPVASFASLSPLTYAGYTSPYSFFYRR